MVSTRNRPSNSSPPPPSPSKAPTFRSSNQQMEWNHVPTPLTLMWLIFSLPLVMWDTAYVLLRPHSMPDGKYQSPIFTPYALYGKIDYIYGWKAYNSKNGFTAAQAALNAVETLGYITYLYIVWKKGRGHRRALDGGWGGLAALVGFALSVMTLSKTALYGQYACPITNFVLLSLFVSFSWHPVRHLMPSYRLE